MKPVWMSRARSVPAFIVEKSAPWMNGTASAKARKESVGKPGQLGGRLQAGGVHGHERDREDERRDDARRLACRADDGAARDRADLRPGAAHALLAARLGLGLLGRALERAPGLREEDVVERRRPQLEVDDVDAVRVHGAHDVGEPEPVPEPHGDVPRRRERLAELREELGDPGTILVGPGNRVHARTADLGLQRGGRPLGDDLALVDDPDPVREDVRLLEVLRRQEDGDAFLPAQAGDLLPERRAALRVETGRRLVEEEDARHVDEREREVEAALHPARVARHLPVAGVREPDALEELVGLRLPLVLRGRPGASPAAAGGLVR